MPKEQMARIDELERDPKIAEAGRYHAFANGESMGATELYAKGANGAVVLNPETLNPRWGIAGEESMPDWRKAVGAAVEAGDMTPAAAARMTQSLEARGGAWATALRGVVWHLRQAASYCLTASAPRGALCGSWQLVQSIFPALFTKHSDCRSR